MFIFVRFIGLGFKVALLQNFALLVVLYFGCLVIVFLGVFYDRLSNAD